MTTETSKPVYIDTSAFYALMDRSDRNHQPAKALWPILLEDRFTLLTSNYVVLETLNLLQSRLGFTAAKIWQGTMLKVVDLQWIDHATYETGQDLWMNLGRLGCSIVDCISYVTMNRLQIKDAFCFKPHFADQGYSLLPGMNKNQGMQTVEGLENQEKTDGRPGCFGKEKHSR